jgi:hypothetical protein
LRQVDLEPTHYSCISPARLCLRVARRLRVGASW